MQPLPDTPKVHSALALARQHPDELLHLEQVARLAGLLFDALAPIHGLGQHQRELLLCAGLLHDVGISISFAKHHKHSLRLIRQSDLPALTADERLVVANVARYHRKAKPKASHPDFAELPDGLQDTVRRLAAILRLADGLDRAHENAVTDLSARPLAPDHWQIDIQGHGDLAFAVWGAERKAGLFGDVYGVALRVQSQGPPPTPAEPPTA